MNTNNSKSYSLVPFKKLTVMGMVAFLALFTIALYLIIEGSNVNAGRNFAHASIVFAYAGVFWEGYHFLKEKLAKKQGPQVLR